MKLTFNPKFLIIVIAIFIIEVLIGKYLNDPFIRPFGGDVLVVVLIYAFLRTFIHTNNRKLALGLLLFACLIEFLQKLNYVAWFGLENNKLMCTLMGTSFSVYDLLAYFAGYLICLCFKD